MFSCVSNCQIRALGQTSLRPVDDAANPDSAPETPLVLSTGADENEVSLRWNSC